MKKIGFIGAFEKTYLILYLAKILTELKKSVLIIDATIMQKSRYIVPKIVSTKSYVTEYEKIDVAVGFDGFEAISKYIGNIENKYDIILVDVDSTKKFSSFEMSNAEILYFVTAFDDFSLRRGVEIVSNIKSDLKMKKILFENEFNRKYSEYLNFLMQSFPIEWESEQIYFPFDQGDLNEIIENQRSEIIKFRNLSEQFKTSLCNVTQEIIPEVKSGEIKKIMKIM